MIIGIVAGGGVPGASPPPDPVPPWTPANISTALWLDAADATTITEVSGAVSQWADKSGNADHATQISASLRPTLQAAVLNGLPVMRFDGTDDRLSLASGVAGVTVCTSFIVTNKPTASSGFRTLLRLDRHQVLSRHSGGDIWACWQNVAVLGTSALTSTFQLLGVTQRAANDVDMVTNGTVTNRTNGTAFPATSAGWVGGVDGLQNHPGDIAEIVVLAAAADVTTRQLVEGYLAHKWGLAGALPGGHPYKDSPP